MKTKIIILLFTLLPSALFAQNFNERAKKTYLETNKNFDIDCFYSRNKTFKLITPKGQTSVGPDSISREFVVETPEAQIPMLFTLERKGKKFEYSVLFNEKHTTRAKFSRREFYIPPVLDRAFDQKFETSRIYCMVNFAYALPYKISDGNYHFNVHPHKKYDWQSRLKEKTERYLNDLNYSSIIFLETGNYRGNLVNIHNFLDGKETTLPETPVDSDLEDVPDTVDLVVSPAGNNRFDFQAHKEINITFTGGNHNYCIWNVTRHVLESLMNSKSEARVNLNYDTGAIVAQTKGVEGMGMNFPRSAVSRSNLLKDLLSNKAEQAQYHPRFLNYFRNYLAQEYSGMYRTYKIRYQAEGYATELILKGNGHRDLEVNFSYF